MWKNNRNRLMAALIGLLLLLPALSYADTVDPSRSPFKLAENDYFLGVLVKNFLGIVPNGASSTMGDVLSGAGTLGDIFRTFNLGIAFFGTLMITFITVVGVVQSGNDGEFLGKRWSSFWVPVRFATGSALMLPVTSSGYSIVQIMILYIAAQGVAFADTLWDTIVTTVVERTGAQVWGNVDGEVIAQQVMIGSMCAAATNYYGQIDGSVPPGKPVYQMSLHADHASKSDSRMSSSADYVYWSQDALNEGDLVAGKAKCGVIKLLTSNNADDVYAGARQKIAAAHVDFIKQMASSFSTPATNFIQSVESPDANALTTARAELQKIMAKAGEDYRLYIAAIANAEVALARSHQQSSGSATPDQMKKYGFVTAGMFYIDMTRVHGAVREAMTATPTFAAGSGMTGVQSYELAMASFKTISPYISQENGTPEWQKQGDVNVSSVSKDVLTIDTADVSTMEPASWVRAQVNKLGALIIQAMFGVGKSNTGMSSNSVTGNGTLELFADTRSTHTNISNVSNNTSSVLELKNKGDNILDLAGVIMIAKTGIVASAEVAEKGLGGVPFFGNWLATPATFIKAVLQDLGAYFLSAIFALIAFGLSLAVYVPMVPYMLWIGGIIGLVVLIAEALVAGPLWAVMIMHPSGEGLTSQQSERGMMLLLGLFTRPALMLMGLVMGMFMLEPLVTLVNDTFYYTMSSVQVSTISGFFSLFGFCTLYVSLILTVVNKCFSMIHIVPDKALRWISGGGEQLGENSLRDHAKGNVGAVASVVGKMAMESGSGREKQKAPKTSKNSWGD